MFRFSVLLLLTLCVPSAVMAASMQECASDSAKARTASGVQTTPREDIYAALQSTGTGPADSPVADPHSIGGTKAGLKTVTELLATSGKSQATIKLTNTYDLQVTCAKGGAQWTTTSHVWSLALSAPVNKSPDQPTDIAGIGGLPGDFEAEFSLSSFVLTSEIDFNTLTAIAQEAARLCAAAAKPDCDREVRDLVKDYDAGMLGKWDRAMGTSSAFTYGLAATVGYGKFEFKDPVTFDKGGLSTTPWSARGFVGYMPSDSWPLIILSVGYDRRYKAADTSTKCPLGPGPILSCTTGVFAPPTAKEALPIALEFRRGFSLCDPDKVKSGRGSGDANNPENDDSACGPLGLSTLGIDLKFSYDAKKHGYGVDLPISFIADEKGNLIGGVRFAWNSEDHDLIAGLFIGTAFSVF